MCFVQTTFPYKFDVLDTIQVLVYGHFASDGYWAVILAPKMTFGAIYAENRSGGMQMDISECSDHFHV